jgi:hypothetical protein
MNGDAYHTDNTHHDLVKLSLFSMSAYETITKLIDPEAHARDQEKESELDNDGM